MCRSDFLSRAYPSMKENFTLFHCTIPVHFFCGMISEGKRYYPKTRRFRTEQNS